MAANDAAGTRQRISVMVQANASGSHFHPSILNEMDCERCGTSNPAQYRFCGKCGHLLQKKPVPVATPESSPPRQATPVSGPSFLGLGESAENEPYSYLLDEEPPRRGFGRAFLGFLMLLLLGAGAYAAYWKFYFVPEQVSTASSVPPAPAFAYERTPSPPSSLAVDPATIPLPSNKLTDQKSLENLAAQTKIASATPAASSSNSPKAKGSGTRHSADDEVPEEGLSQSAKLLADGEKYLYGRGVPSNCKRAVKSFEAAAELDDPKAMSRLGSLYASGRCVTFDRVKAYQWFARAKNVDPNDTWAEASMDMLWRSMNRTERSSILK
jgi:Sel1 repeat